MSDIFISYARSTAPQAQAVAEALRALGYGVWLDDELPAHRAYAEVIEERLKAAKAVVVIWSAEAAKSQWVRAEADMAREARNLVQLSVDGAALPLPFNQIQCADLAGWNGDAKAPGWRKVIGSIETLVHGASPSVDVSGVQPPLPSKPSIALLPFSNLSGDPEQDYFADGMVEEIAAALSRFKSIFVIAGGSTLSFKGQAVSPQDVARQLGVRYVLEGSVRKAGARVRIAVKLIDAGDGAQIWADRFEDTLEDVFALQDRVALSVAGVIEPTVQQAEISRVSKRPTENMGSYDLYLRALPLILSVVRAELLQAIELLERALTLDPDFGSALAMAAQAYAFVVIFGWSDDPARHRRRGIELAQRALRVGGDDAYVLAWAAYALIILVRNLDAGASEISRAVALNPGSATVWYLSGALHVRRGEPDIGAAHLETAIRLDPRSSIGGRLHMFLAIARLEQGRLAEAAAMLKVTTRQIDSPFGHAMLAAVLGHLGEIAQARDSLARHRELTDVPASEIVVFFDDPKHQKMFLDGLALAEGKDPPAIGGGA